MLPLVTWRENVGLGGNGAEARHEKKQIAAMTEKLRRTSVEAIPNDLLATRCTRSFDAHLH